MEIDPNILKMELEFYSIYGRNVAERLSRIKCGWSYGGNWQNRALSEGFSQIQINDFEQIS